MKPTVRPLTSQDEAIISRAAAWLVERDEGLSPEAEAEFARWRQADSRHEAAVARLESTWDALRQLENFRPETRMHPNHDLLARPTPGVRLPFPALAAAGLAAGLAVAGAWWLLRPAFRHGEAPPAAAAYATGDNGYSRTVLPDGSVVELNADSRLTVAYTPRERRVRLDHGEAHFKVAKNKARPFWVVAGPIAVRAVGTEFDVSLRPASVEVLVTEGRVQVSRDSAAAPPLASLAASERTIISLGRANSAPRVETVTPAALSEELAWQGPRLQFADTPLSEVVRQFNRCNGVQLELDPVLASKRVGGSFQAENVEAFVRLLSGDGNIVLERPDATHIILRSGR